MHTFPETLRHVRSCHLIGWIWKDFWEMCLSLFLTVLLETTQSCHVCIGCNINCCTVCKDNCINLWLLLLWPVNKCTPVCYCGNISTPLNMTLQNDWLLFMSVRWTLGRALAEESDQSSHTCSLATWDYRVHTTTITVMIKQSLLYFKFNCSFINFVFLCSFLLILLDVCIVTTYQFTRFIWI